MAKFNILTGSKLVQDKWGNYPLSKDGNLIPLPVCVLRTTFFLL